MHITNTMTVVDLIEFENFETMWKMLTSYLTTEHTNTLNREVDESYQAYSIEDMLSIPTVAVADYLTDVKPVLESLHLSVKHFKAMYGADANIREAISVAPYEFIWTDDNIRTSALNLEIVDELGVLDTLH